MPDVYGKCFKVKSELMRDKTVHSGEKPFVCPECGLSFCRQRYLNNREKSRHLKNSDVSLTLMEQCEFII